MFAKFIIIHTEVLSLGRALDVVSLLENCMNCNMWCNDTIWLFWTTL